MQVSGQKAELQSRGAISNAASGGGGATVRVLIHKSLLD